MDALKAQGGRLEAGSVRKIAKLIGARKSTVHSTLAALLATGAIGRVGKAIVLG
jgi:DNA-binding IclR family transcriptional regulator